MALSALNTGRNNRDEDVSGGRGALSCDGRQEVWGGSGGRGFPLRISVAEKAGESPPPPPPPPP